MSKKRLLLLFTLISLSSTSCTYTRSINSSEIINPPIKNFVKNDHDTNKGTWIFELKPQETKPVKARAKRHQPAKKSTNQTKSSGKRASIRGRMSKIAKNIDESI